MKVCFKNLKLKVAAKNLQYLNNSNKIILTPHIAGLTRESELKISQVYSKNNRTKLVRLIEQLF